MKCNWIGPTQYSLNEIGTLMKWFFMNVKLKLKLENKLSGRHPSTTKTKWFIGIT